MMSIKKTIAGLLVALMCACLTLAACFTVFTAKAEDAVTPTTDLNITALNKQDENTRSFYVYFKEGTLLMGDGGSFWVTNQVGTLGSYIKVNGTTLSQINTACGDGHTQVHWAEDGSGADVLRIDCVYGGMADKPFALKANAVNTLELDYGIKAPNGTILPKAYIEYLTDSDISAQPANTRMFSSVKPQAASGTVGVSGVQFKDSGENYKISVEFDGLAAESQVTNQGAEYFIANYVKINGAKISDIKWSATADAIDAHWFTGDAADNGYLAIYMKKAIAESYGMKLDGTDTLEILEGFRTYTNKSVETAAKFMYDGTEWKSTDEPDEPLPPTISKTDYTVKQGVAQDLTISIDFADATPSAVKCDGTALSESDYTAEASLVLTKSFVSALEAGEHSFTVETDMGDLAFTVTVEEVDPNTPTTKVNVSAVESESASVRKFIIYFTDNILVNGTQITSTVAKYGSLIRLNGFTLSKINEVRGGIAVQVHWMKNGANEYLRIDVPTTLGSGDNAFAEAALKANAINTLEIDYGLVAPNGTVLPKMYGEYRLGENFTAAPENVKIFSSVLSKESTGTVRVASVGAITEVDGGENQQIKIYFDGKVTDEQIIQRGTEYYIANYVKINGTLIKDIYYSATAAAIDAHWFTDDEAGNGYLAINMKSAIAESYRLKKDGSDTIEILEGMRTANNQTVEGSGKMIYTTENAWVSSETAAVSAKAEVAPSDRLYIYVTFDKTVANSNNAEAEIDADKILFNGVALSQVEGFSSIYRVENGVTVLRIRIAASAVSEGKDVLTFKAGFETPNGYTVAADADLNVEGIAPAVTAEALETTVGAVADLDVATDVAGKAIISVRCGENALDSENYSYADGTLTLRKAYLETLGAGEYSFTVETSEGSAGFNLIVKAAEEPVEPDELDTPDVPGNDSGDEKPEKESGCGSSLASFGAVAIALPLVIAAAVCALRRKD